MINVQKIMDNETQSWLAQKQQLTQKIELLQITISDLKERESKIRRINQTLFHSLSTNSEHTSSSPGLQRILTQQSAEISRLYDRLRNNSVRDSKFDRVDQIKSEDVRRLMHENSLLRRKIQEMEVRHEEEVKQISRVYEGKIGQLIRGSKDKSKGVFSNQVLVKGIEQGDGTDRELRSKVEDFENLIEQLREQCVSLRGKNQQLERKLEYSNIEFKRPMESHKNMNMPLQMKPCRDVSQNRSKQQAPPQVSVNMSGYINFLKANRQSLNCRLLTQQQQNAVTLSLRNSK